MALYPSEKLGGGTSLTKLGDLSGVASGSASNNKVTRITNAAIFLVIMWDSDAPSNPVSIVFPNLPDVKLRTFYGGCGTGSGRDVAATIMIDYDGVNRTIGLWDWAKAGTFIPDNRLRGEVYYI